MRSTILPILTIALLISSTGAPAQDAPPEEVEPAREEAVETAEAADSADDGRAPDDYEASEQISEDLSVSFPVDI